MSSITTMATKRSRRSQNNAEDLPENFDGNEQDVSHTDVSAAAAPGGESNDEDDGERSGDNPVRFMRQRNRAVAEREASRLARPDAPLGSMMLGHASKAKSAVMSTPFGQLMGRKASTKREDNISQEWCGPFSVARQMIAAREEARRLREEQQDLENNKEHHPLDEAMEIVNLEMQRKENPSMNWVSRHKREDGSTTTNYYAKRRKRFHRQRDLMGGSSRVPSLFQLCINLLVENFDCIESLGVVDHSIRRALCETLVARGKMNGAAFDVLAEMGVETLELVDCAQVTQDQFCDSLRVLLPSGLRAILLKHCGRCFGSQAVNVIASIDRENMELFAISLGGAYLLKDSDMAALIESTSRTLSSLDLTACPLLSEQFCNAIGNQYSSSIEDPPNAPLLELSIEDVPLTKEVMLSLGAASDALRNLKSLKLKTMENVDDEVVSIILGSITGGEIEGIDLSNNPSLTDETLSSIRRCNFNGNLRALLLSGLKNLTAIGIEAFFTPIPNFPAPPILRKLDLSQCSYDEINDTVLTLAATSSSFKRASANAIEEETVLHNAGKLASEVSYTGGLVHLNVSGSSISDKSMEILAATSSYSLEELDISFCPNVSDKGLGYLVSKVKPQLSKIFMWGCAQITEEFLDGHDRIEDGGLEIIGVWMKKSGVRSLR
mmetsp:Transcript_9414/g.20044  ORF Transcript_9414/g.20044 Transcript_9414/m.20044 type:complete len:665 (-) Transcript_9414:127-2121(-)